MSREALRVLRQGESVRRAPSVLASVLTGIEEVASPTTNSPLLSFLLPDFMATVDQITQLMTAVANFGNTLETVGNRLGVV